MCIYDVSWDTHFGFCCDIDEKLLVSSLAQIMLEMVTPQMLQMPNIWQASGQPLSQDGQQGQQPVVQTLPGLPSLAQNKMQFGLMPRVQEGQISSLHPNSLAHSQYSALPQLPTHPQVKLPQLPLNQVLQQGTLPGHSGISVLPSIRPLLVVFVFILQNFSRMDDFEMKLPHMFFQPVRMATVDHILQSTSAIKDYPVHCLKIRVASCNLWQSCPPVTNVQAFLLSVARSLFQQIIYAHRKSFEADQYAAIKSILCSFQKNMITIY